MKMCFKCGAEKPLSGFYSHSKMRDGKLNKCKECTKADTRRNRGDNLEYYRNYDRNRPNREERNRNYCERSKERYYSNPEHREKTLEAVRTWIERNPNKRKAQNSVSNAIRDGKLIKTTVCEHCFVKSDRIHGHHWSYKEEHWLDVIWLCPKCHGAEHKRLNDVARNS